VIESMGVTMDLSLFTSLEGRISRQKLWLGAFVLMIAIFVVFFVLRIIFGVSVVSTIDATMSPEGIAAVVRKLTMLSIAVLIVFVYPISALMKKRLNDRDRPAWYMYVFWAPTAINLLLSLAGMTYTMAEVGGVMVPVSTTAGWLIGLAGLVIGIWALVELGFLRGTNGSNRHGPDPLAT